LIELLAREGVNTTDWCVDNLSIYIHSGIKKYIYRRAHCTHAT